MPILPADDVARWSGGAWSGAIPARLDGVSTDTRTLRAGSLFFALAGRNSDGHKFVPEAFAKGAAAAVVQEGNDACPSGAPSRPLLLVKDPLAALQRIARGHRLSLSAELVGITGSAGKTTVKEMTASCLGAAMSCARTPGNWNNELGLPLSLLSMERSDRAGVFEVGISHPGEMGPLCDILNPTWGVITNVGPVHTEFFASTDDIAREKSVLFARLPAAGTAVMWRDDAHYDLLRRAARGKAVTVSLKGGADYVRARRHDDGRTMDIAENSTGDTATLTSPLPGDHNAVNTMLAVGVCRGMGLSWRQIEQGLTAYTSPPMRWAVRKIRGVTAVNDAYNANPMSMRAAMDTFAEMKVDGRKWLVLGGMLELGEREAAEHAGVGRHAAGGPWSGLVTAGRLGAMIADAAEAAGMRSDRVTRCATVREAADALARSLAPGDAFLLKASRGIRLEEVLECLEAKG